MCRYRPVHVKDPAAKKRYATAKLSAAVPPILGRNELAGQYDYILLILLAPPPSQPEL